MFEWLAAFNRILVTGPHRAGTRIATKMIAYDTGHQYIDEYEIYMDSLTALRNIFFDRRRFVVQCPSLCRYSHLFSADDTAIIIMRRDLDEIIPSQERVDWQWEKLELMRYDLSEGRIAEVKYRYWEEVQKPLIVHPFEIEYVDLAQHPLWLPKEKRQSFEASQTTLLNDEFALDTNAHFYAHPYAHLITEDHFSDEDTAVLIKLRDTAHKLNPTAQLVWKLCDGQHAFQDIVRALQAEYPDIDEETLARDAKKLIRKLLMLDFVQLVSAEGAKRNRDHP